MPAPGIDEDVFFMRTALPEGHLGRVLYSTAVFGPVLFGSTHPVAAFICMKSTGILDGERPGRGGVSTS